MVESKYQTSEQSLFFKYNNKNIGIFLIDDVLCIVNAKKMKFNFWPQLRC